MRLHPEVRVNVTINVARSEDEAERQARGEDVLAERTEEEEAEVAAEELFEEGAGPSPRRNVRRRLSEASVLKRNGRMAPTIASEPRQLAAG